ncbi:MAG: alpha/beta fold hydrolase [Cyclobacteriaceae bacterium]
MTFFVHFYQKFKQLLQEYKRPFLLSNSHFETIYPALFRQVKNTHLPLRERIITSDGDFLDLDWYQKGSKKLLILQHGLEGSSDRPYMLGMARAFLDKGYDVCSWNYRGCSGEMNKQPVFYHSGATYDLDTVVKKGLESYDDLTLIGFSLGGNLTLKYLGEAQRNDRIKQAVAVSVPLDLGSGADNLDTPKCFIYQKRFLNNLLRKVRIKNETIPGFIDLNNLEKIDSIRSFDEYVTAPLHGFKGAEDYYQQNSSKQFLKNISVPTLILNAGNDPLLTPNILNPNIQKSEQVEYQITKHGGHVGYARFGSNKPYWSELRALEFCESH